ncbi:MAG: T9SS type A sorting domain-containing protein [candidate division Zixibacteria bacterium]|nr:T9SS type A sorting domain-containing protein [candidate division Zixibacteria bacterium]
MNKNTLVCLLILLVAVVIPLSTIQGQHYRSPEWTERPDDMSGSHCETFTATVKAKSRVLVPDVRLGPIKYRVLSGPGVVDSRTGVWEWSPSIEESGMTYTVVIAAVEGRNITTGSKACRFDVTVTNSVPTLSPNIGECGSWYDFNGLGNHTIWIFSHDIDPCDPTTNFIAAVEPEPSGWLHYAEAGILHLEATAPDTGKVFRIVCGATDGKDTSYCEVFFNVRAESVIPEPYVLRIEKTHNSLQGMHEYIDVTLEAGDFGILGFDLLIVFNASAMAFQTITEGEIYEACDWEYFTYRYNYLPGEEPGGARGRLRVFGMAETNNGPYHPTCYNLETKPFTLFTMDFLVTDDRTYECYYAPIRFYWEDCGDNVMTFHRTDDQNPYSISTGVSRFVFDYDYGSELTDPEAALPTYFGAPNICLEGAVQTPIRYVDFINGGIDIIGCDSVEANRGDININGIANEIADAVLYANYFVYGLSVFDNQQAQISQSDVNKDGITLTIQDFVYQIRIIVGDALPYPPDPPITPVSMMVEETNIGIQTDWPLGAAYLVFNGVISPTLLADQMGMKYAYRLDDSATHVLVYDIGSEYISSGLLLSYPPGSELLDASFATYEGYPVDLTILDNLPTKSDTEPGLPDRFTVYQNYPNPFNTGTAIPFYVSQFETVELVIINVLGEQVYRHVAFFSEGEHQIMWEGTDDDGLPVASGIYYYRLRSDVESVTRKMLLLK